MRYAGQVLVESDVLASLASVRPNVHVVLARPAGGGGLGMVVAEDCTVLSVDAGRLLLTGAHAPDPTRGARPGAMAANPDQNF